MANEDWPVYGEITGPVVMIGFGSIGRGTLPLIERHFKFDKSRMTVIDPRDTDRKLLDERGITFVQDAVTKKNYKKLLTPLLTSRLKSATGGWNNTRRRSASSRSSSRKAARTESVSTSWMPVMPRRCASA